MLGNLGGAPNVAVFGLVPVEVVGLVPVDVVGVVFAAPVAPAAVVIPPPVETGGEDDVTPATVVTGGVLVWGEVIGDVTVV